MGGLFGGGGAASREEILEKDSIVGATHEFRNVTVADRLETPPAQEAKTSGLASKYEVMKNLLDLDLEVDDLEVPGFRVEQEETRRSVGAIRQGGLLAEILAAKENQEMLELRSAAKPPNPGEALAIAVARGEVLVHRPARALPGPVVVDDHDPAGDDLVVQRDQAVHRRRVQIAVEAQDGARLRPGGNFHLPAAVECRHLDGVAEGGLDPARAVRVSGIEFDLGPAGSRGDPRPHRCGLTGPSSRSMALG